AGLLQHPRQAEIVDAQPARLREQQLRRLEVAVNDVFVGMTGNVGHIGDQASARVEILPAGAERGGGESWRRAGSGDVGADGIQIRQARLFDQRAGSVNDGPLQSVRLPARLVTSSAEIRRVVTSLFPNALSNPHADNLECLPFAPRTFSGMLL